MKAKIAYKNRDKSNKLLNLKLLYFANKHYSSPINQKLCDKNL